MGYAKLKQKLEIDEYLKGEEISPIRYEYLFGEVYAMAGVSQNHSRLNGNLFNLISARMADENCEVYSENIKVRPSFEVFYYPDMIVSCEGDFTNKYICDEPRLIIEVISPSTERIDRREKLPAYQAMPTVREILFVDQERVSLELFRRQPDGGWIVEYYDDSDSSIELNSVGITLQIIEIYRRVVFEV